MLYLSQVVKTLTESKNMSDTYKVAGVATDKRGNTKVRYANDLAVRTKVLTANKFTDIQLFDFKDDFEKSELCQMLLANADFDKHETVIRTEIKKIELREHAYSVKVQRKNRKLAVANISVADVLAAIK